MAAPVSTPVFAIRDDDGVRLMVDEHGAAPSLVTMPVPPAVANCASMMLPDGRPVATVAAAIESPVLSSSSSVLSTVNSQEWNE